MNPLLQLPMLGEIEGDRYAISHLHRDVEHAIAAPAEATVRVGERSFLAPVEGLAGHGARARAVMLDKAKTYLDLPAHVSLTTLAR